MLPEWHSPRSKDIGQEIGEGTPTRPAGGSAKSSAETSPKGSPTMTAGRLAKPFANGRPRGEPRDLPRGRTGDQRAPNGTATRIEQGISQDIQHGGAAQEGTT